jgi:glycosyltransferase involved in cell wall biosynthesis
MQIAFDAKRAFLNNSGLGNYARTLIRSLREYYPQNEYTLFSPKLSDSSFAEQVAADPQFRVRTPETFIDKKLRSRWRSYGITAMLKEQHVDVYHGLSNELPFNISDFKGKKIVTIHDLIFVKHPELYPYLDRKIYNKKFRHACDAADVVVAISEETKKHIEEHYFIPDNKIKVIYQSCDPIYYQTLQPQVIEAVSQRHQLPAEYLLYVGTIEERKNLLTIVKALKEIKDIPLVVVGNKKSYFDKVKAYIDAGGLSKRVLFLDKVGHDELPVIYSKASVFIFPSFFEGFGIPIIEALTSKIPVITTKGGCFPEAGGPDSFYVDPLDEKQMAEMIRTLLASTELRKEMAEKGFAYAMKFHPEKIAAQMMSLYQHK